MREPISRFRQSLVVTASLLLASASGLASAAVFQSTWDPQFDSSFTGTYGPLGWKGTSTVTVDPGCLTTSDVVNFPNGCGTSAFNGFTLNFYNTSDNSGLGGFGAAGSFPAPTAVSFDAFGVVDGIAVPGWLPASIIPYNFFGYDFDAAIAFTLSPFNGPVLRLTRVCPELVWEDEFSTAAICEPTVYFSATEGSDVPTVRWTEVPEPMSLALLGAGLAALGFSRRASVAK